MLPTKGYFRDIDCPYHERTCGRPYCHFRHRKKTQETEDSKSSKAVPTYKPTPKSELASNKSHIPISYVPDIVRSSTRSSYNIKDRPTYKPTPKSVLSNTLQPPTVSPYTPTPISQLQDDTISTDLNLDELSQEFQMIDDILTDSATASESHKQDKAGNKEDRVLKQSKASNEGDLVQVTQDSKDKIDHKQKDRNRDKSKEKRSKSSSSSTSSSTKSKEKDKKRVSKDDIKDKDKEKKDKHRSSSSSTKEKDNETSKSSRSKDRDKDDKHRKDKHRSSSSSSSKNKHHDKEKHKSSTSSTSKPKTGKNETTEKVKEKPPIFEISDDDVDADIDLNFEDEDDDPDMDSMMIEDECFKIFNEYRAPEVDNAKPTPEVAQGKEPDPQASLQGGKRRIAYTNAVPHEEPKPRAIPKALPNAGMTLQNRMRIARQAHAANEGQNIMQEMKHIKRSAPVAASSNAKRSKPNGLPRPVPAPQPKPSPKPSTSVIDDILSGRSTTTMSSTSSVTAAVTAKPRRIAPATNVLSIQKAKAKIDAIKNKYKSNTAKTSAQTVSVGSKRVAHVPDMSLATIPDVLHADRSKLPVNVRTRYLGLLADECVKLYVVTEEAYTRALSEEFKCYEKCSAVITYRNSAMLAVNRLRKEAQEREDTGLGPLQAGETPNKDNDSNLEGERFYDRVKAYMLSEEELDLHGFPRESTTPGRAVINYDHKQITSESLERNQRLCCRCHKVYLINRDGFPLFEEECCYHPLRKRTIRGERMYLCCKSTEDTGCVMSTTHVSEVSADRELEGFQSTFESDREDDPRNHAVYALDCEMCYTTKGLELTRVTVVNSKLKIIYESLVKPFNPIIDYNTRFSGITAEHMEKTTTNILQIQATILHLCSAKTILIGHSLESDLKALKIIHNSVVDTSVMFPHKFGLPHKRALRALASDYLRKIIQNDVGGHDSAEDALAAIELVVWKVKDDLKVKGIKH